MPIQRPLLNDIIDRVQGDLAARLPGTDPRLRHSVLDILSRVQAGAIHGLYGLVEYAAQQAIIDTADAEHLERHAGVWGVARKVAAAATGAVVFSGTDGSVIAAASLLQRADGVEYSVDADATIVAGVATAAVTAVVGGAAGDAVAATGVSLTSPIAGVNTAAVIDAGGITGGADIETDAALRTRLLARIQRPAHGGASFDYDNWGLEVPGVTRAWTVPLYAGPGTVALVVATDNAASPIADPATVAAVQAHIDPLKPVTAIFTALAPTEVGVNFTITLVPNTVAVQQAVQAELADLFLREGYPGNTLYLTHFAEAISRGTGETNHTLVAPVADIVLTATELATLGAITWQ